MIKLENISVHFGNETILENLSIKFQKGTLTSIIGVNGSGKTTLLKSLLGMVPFDTGTITIDGENLKTMCRKNRAKKMAYLSQGKNTPDMSVEQLVLHGRFPYLNYPRIYTKQDYDIAALAMDQMGIKDISHKSLQQLSGGMCQKAYIAMALTQGADYILMDEPTTYLDISHQLELMKTLRKLADNGKGILTVMHDLPMAFTFSDRIILLNNKKIVLDDQPTQIYQNESLRQIFGILLECSPDKTYYSYNYLPIPNKKEAIAP